MGNTKRALIIGALGQDGSYMWELLEAKGYDVYGAVRPGTDISRLRSTKQFAADLCDKEMAKKILLSIRPEMVFNFAGVSNVFSPFSGLDHILDLNTRLPQNLLEAIVENKIETKFFQSSSCLVFGNDTSGLQDESTPRDPIYPYGASKAYADNLIRMFREEFRAFACSGIFFNHESPRRGNGFFSKKIADAAKNKQKIKVGDLSAVRDYGFAGDFVEAAYMMLQADAPEDYVIGTGTLTTMGDFAKKCFEEVGLDHQEYLEFDPAFTRKDTQVLCADITKIKNKLGWTPKHTVDDLVKIMMHD